MADATVIGRGTRIRGKVSGSGDLEIDGQVEGEVSVEGDLTVGSTGIVSSDLAGRRIIVRGAVQGDVTGEESIALEDGARVVGTVRAPRVAILPGALMRGRLEVGDFGVAPPARVTTSSQSKPSSPSRVAATSHFAPARASAASAQARVPAPPVIAQPRASAQAAHAARRIEVASPPPRHSEVSALALDVEQEQEEEGPPSSEMPVPLNSDENSIEIPSVPSIKKGARGMLAKKR